MSESDVLRVLGLPLKVTPPDQYERYIGRPIESWMFSVPINRYDKFVLRCVEFEHHRVAMVVSDPGA
jgi:hypothetical protein